MSTLCFYFQVHQPYRVKRYAYEEIGQRADYFDDWLNEDVVKRVAERCYLPMNAVLRRAIEETDGAFRVAFSISGTALRQFEQWTPEVIDSFRGLVATGGVELLCETSRHSLSALVNPEEFAFQVEEQRALLRRLFGVSPTTFRNTELIVDPAVARQVRDLGFDLLVGEGADVLMEGRAPSHLFEIEGAPGLPILLRDYRYSDDIAFRFSNPAWEEHPLFAETFVRWMGDLDEDRVVGLFMDYETFGEHQPAQTGIFDFMSALPGQALERGGIEFKTPSELRPLGTRGPAVTYPRPVSWADEERDLSAWFGNHMQRAASDAIWSLRDAALSSSDPAHAEAWRDLTTSDHVYYVATACATDGDVHEYFSPFGSPHDAFLTLMNVVEDFGRRLGIR
ncbi:MAG: glycoside hydrolase family 57 protein [Planctomycetota bacterium]|nr:glycoside hydrolase family 57 protein [Planctomycetota bacterium]